MDDVVIRRAAASDLPRLGELAGKLVRQHHRTDPRRFMLVDDVERGYAWWFGKELESADAVLLVACSAEAIVGYAYARVHERDWNSLLDRHGALEDIFVDETGRRRGVGMRLMEATVAELRARDAPIVVLSTMVSNAAAQRLFAACGFRPTMLEMTKDLEPT